MHLEPKEDVSWKSLDTGYVLLDLKSGHYYTLNETASIIWEAVLGNETEDQVVAKLLEQYEGAEAEEIRQDVRAQVDMLLAEGLAVPRAASAPS